MKVSGEIIFQFWLPTSLFSYSVTPLAVNSTKEEFIQINHIVLEGLIKQNIFSRIWVEDLKRRVWNEVFLETTVKGSWTKL